MMVSTSRSHNACPGGTKLLSGMYQGGTFEFSFQINANYPHDPPKVKCVKKVCGIPALAVSSGCIRSYWTDLPSKRRSGRQCLLEHPPRRLEASAEPERRHGWASIPLPRTECGRPTQQGYVHFYITSRMYTT